jgi:hypothetical protein
MCSRPLGSRAKRQKMLARAQSTVDPKLSFREPELFAEGWIAVKRQFQRKNLRSALVA